MNIGDIPTKVLLLLLFVVIALAATLAVALMRFFYRVSGHERVYKNGIVMTEGGIEYLGFPFTGTRKKTFDEIDSVELSPYFKVAISALCFRYGLNTNRVPPNFFGDILVIGFKHPNPFRYLFFCAPKDATDIYEQIKSRIGHERRVALYIAGANADPPLSFDRDMTFDYHCYIAESAAGRCGSALGRSI